MLWRMMELVDIDLLGDEALQASIMARSVWIMAVGTLAGALGAAVLPHEPLGHLWLVVLGTVSVLALPVHELVHAVAFKVLSAGKARISFGFSGWMLYTAAPGCMLGRRAFCAVLLAPAVLVTAALGMGALVFGRPLMAWFLCVVHLAGCTGDTGYVRIIAGEPDARMVMDTERGITLLCDE